MTRERRLFAVATLGFSLMVGIPAIASQVPVGAESLAHRMNPELLDNQGQIFRYPQKAVTLDPQCFVLRTDTGSDIGVIHQVGRVGLALLAQSPTTNNSGYPYYQDVHEFHYVPESITAIYQAAAALDLGMAKLGAAFRIGHDSFEEEDLRSDLNSSYYNGLSNHSTIREFSIGTQFEGGSTLVDIGCDIIKENIEKSGLQLDTPDTSLYQAATDLSYTPSFTIRGSQEFSGGRRLSLFGTLRSRRAAIQLQTYSARFPDLSLDSYASPHVQDWSAGISWTQPVARKMEAHTFAAAFNTRSVQTTNSSSSDSRYATEFFESYRLGTGFTYVLASGWKAMSGISWAHGRSEEVRYRFATNQYETTYTDRTSSRETLTNFGWGLKKSIRRFDFVATLSTSLSLGNLFGTMSFAARF